MNKQTVIQEIEETFSKLRSALSKFSEEELNRVPLEGSWTAGQVTEHIIKSIGGIPDEQTEPADRPYNEKINSIREMFLNMEMKFKTDPLLEPERPYHELDDLFNILQQLETQHIETVKKADMKALCLDMELPKFGYLTRHEWMRFMMVHTQRHTMQIENIYEKLKS